MTSSTQFTNSVFQVEQLRIASQADALRDLLLNRRRAVDNNTLPAGQDELLGERCVSCGREPKPTFHEDGTKTLEHLLATFPDPRINALHRHKLLDDLEYLRLVHAASVVTVCSKECDRFLQALVGNFLGQPRFDVKNVTTPTGTEAHFCHLQSGWNQPDLVLYVSKNGAPWRPLAQ